MTNPTLEQRALDGVREDSMVATGDQLEWLIRQLVAWPTRVDERYTTNCGFLMASAARTLHSLTFSHTGVEQAIEACAKVADEAERLQDNDHGAANTGGAAQAAAAIRATLPAQSPDDIAYAGAVQGERYCNHAATYQRPDTGETGPIYCVNCAPKNLKAASPVNVEGQISEADKIVVDAFHRIIAAGSLDEMASIARQALASLSPDGER